MGYTVFVNGMASIHANGHERETAEFSIRPATTLYAYADYQNSGEPMAEMLGSYGGGYANTAVGFGANVGNSTNGGSDTAYYYDSPGDDTFVAYDDNDGAPSAEMNGNYGSYGAYQNDGNGFATNIAYSTNGGEDTDYLEVDGLVDNGTYYAYTDYSNSGQPAAGIDGSYAGYGAYASSAIGFPENYGESTHGGGGTSYLYDSTGNAVYDAEAENNGSDQSGQSAGMTVPGCFILASGFTTNIGTATNVSDTAVFSDSAGSSTFYSYDDYNNSGEPAAGMYGNYGGGYANSAIGFGTCYASSQFGGSDTAYLYDSLGNATFDAYGPLNAQTTTLAFMYAKYETIVSGFASNAAYTTEGSSDTANFYDTVGVLNGLGNSSGLGDATYYADADYNNSGQPAAGMYGSYDGGYTNWAIGFDTNAGDSIIGGANAYFYDSRGNATYDAYANLNGQTSASMDGSYDGGYANSAVGFSTNAAYTTDGSSDTANFYDSAGNDTYYAYADYNSSGQPAAGMYGSYDGGYANSATGFGANVGYSTNGGSDTAYFYDSPGNDTYYAYADYQNSGQTSAGMYGGVPGTPGPGGGYANSAIGFATNVGYSTNGGSDTAYFYDSPGNDTLYAYADYQNSGQTAAGMYGSYGGGYANAACGFATNVGYSTNGGSDTAYFYDSPGNDAFYAYADYNDSGQTSAGMYGTYLTGGNYLQYANSAVGFATNVGYSTEGGRDWADLFGAPQSSNTYYAYIDYGDSGTPAAGMYGGFGGGYFNMAYGFVTNIGYSLNGGSDTAYFYGSSDGDDVFSADANGNGSGQTSAGMGDTSGKAYANGAYGFGTNLGYSTGGTAYLYGSSGNNALYTDLAIAELYGSNGFSSAGYGEQASGFAVVDASAARKRQQHSHPGSGPPDLPVERQRHVGCNVGRIAMRFAGGNDRNAQAREGSDLPRLRFGLRWLRRKRLISARERHNDLSRKT